jgi:hypothetical protein
MGQALPWPGLMRPARERLLPYRLGPQQQATSLRAAPRERGLPPRRARGPGALAHRRRGTCAEATGRDAILAPGPAGDGMQRVAHAQPPQGAKARPSVEPHEALRLVRLKEPFCFMQGYNGMPERTVEPWRNFWFHTGDAGRIDERRYLWYIDRIKDVIRRHGENISSYEVEAVLRDYPGIADVAAVAVNADEGGKDEVLVCAVLEAGAT